MHRLMLLIAAITFATPLHAEGIPQNVRFAQPTVPNGIVTPPKVLVHPYAAYSDEARQRGIEGNVVVQARFDEQGNFTVLKVVRGVGYGLDEAALVALQQWRFSPALQNGLPVAAIAEIEVPFRTRAVERLESQNNRTEITADLIERAGRILYAKGNVLVQVTSIQSGKVVWVLKGDRVNFNLDKIR